MTPFVPCRPVRLAALAFLATALVGPSVAKAAPDPVKLEQFYEDTEVLRRIFYDQQYQALSSFEELRRDQKNTIVFFLGADEIDQVPGGLDHFVEQGGAVLIATSYRFNSASQKRIEKLTGLSVSVGGRLIYPKGTLTEQLCYGNKPHCPFLRPNRDLESPFDKLFQKGGMRNSFFDRVTANEPSYLVLNGAWKQQAKELAYLPRGGIIEGTELFFQDEMRFALGAALEKNGGRFLLLANHRLFLNRMMLPRDTDNVEFAQNCLSFLGRLKDGETRTRLLFVQYGEIKSKFDIPLEELPDLPDNLGEMILDGLLRLAQRLPRLQEKLAQAEERDELHRGLWRKLESRGLSGADVMRWVLFAGSGLFALYGLFRVGGPGRYRLDPATPLAPRDAAKHLLQGQLFERRQREMLDNDNLWEPARNRARLVLLAAGFPEPRSGTDGPTVQVRGDWWRRRLMRRRALRLWRLAFDPTPQLVPKKAWTLIDRELVKLKAELASGAVRFV